MVLAQITFWERTHNRKMNTIFPKYQTTIEKEIPDNWENGFMDNDYKYEQFDDGNWYALAPGEQCKIFIETDPETMEYYRNRGDEIESEQ